MASKVMVKLPCSSFAQVNKPDNLKEDLVVKGRSENASYHLEVQNENNKVGRIAQLEQNIKFLQQQHQQMLGDLHKEIDNLRCRNRELLFHLIFTKGTVPSQPSSPEQDEAKVSPKNTIPLQVELLEKELTELKLQLQESENQNALLSTIIEEQKKKLERFARERERDLERVPKPDPELLNKLDDAEALIRRLRRENTELRRDHANLPSSSNSSDGYRQRERGNYHNQRPGSSENKGNRHRGNGGGRSNYRGNWFPPLHSQSYWHGGRVSEKCGDDGEGGTSFPNLSIGGNNFQHRRGSNNNRYNTCDGKKYEGTPNKGKRRS